MSDNDMRQLMLAAEQVSAEVTSRGGALPHLDRNLRQVCEASRDLWSRLSQSTSEGTQAHLLLGSKGVDLSQLSQRLEALSSRDLLAPLEPIPDTDIDSYLRNETQNAILAIIEESRIDHYQSVDVLERTMSEEAWLKEKESCLNNILEEAGDALKSDQFSMQSQAYEATTLGEMLQPGKRSLMNSQEMAYAIKVIEYNKSIWAGNRKQPLVHIFTELALSLNDKKVHEFWDSLCTMTHLPIQLTGDCLKSRNSDAVQNALVKQAISYLEGRYKTYMQSVVTGNLQKAMRGGIPGTFPLVRSFVAIQESSPYGLEDGLLDGQPIWPLIFYCLRSGDIKAALYCSQQAPVDLSIVPILEELASGDKFLSDRTLDNLRFQYRRNVCNSTDPYKRIVYCVLGSCDIREEHVQVVRTAEDYLWLKLSQIRPPKEKEGVADSPTDVMTYNHLQNLIVEEYGEAHYQASEQPFLYTQMLLLTGQFEVAIEFLSRTASLRHHGVHAALALAEGGLLATPKNLQAPLLSVDDNDPSPSKRLNIARLVSNYCRKFEHADFHEALHYTYFLRDLKSADGGNLFKLYCCDFAMETRAFSELLGLLTEDGLRIPGLIDPFFTTLEECHEIIHSVAEESEKKSMLEDAIKLYELCGDHEGCLRVLICMMAQVLSQKSEAGSVRERINAMADGVIKRHGGRHLNCPASTAASFNLLRQLLQFFNFYYKQEYPLAIEIINKTNLLPLCENDIEDRVKAFRVLHESVKRNFPDVLIATMEILCAQFTRMRDRTSTLFPGGRQNESMEFLRKRGQILTAFSATLPFSMPGDTNSRLVQLMMVMD